MVRMLNQAVGEGHFVHLCRRLPSTTGVDAAARSAYRRRGPTVVPQFLFGRPNTREAVLSSGYLPPAGQQDTFRVPHPRVCCSRVIQERPMAGSPAAAGTEEARDSGRDRVSERSLRRCRSRPSGLRETALSNSLARTLLGRGRLPFVHSPCLPPNDRPEVPAGVPDEGSKLRKSPSPQPRGIVLLPQTLSPGPIRFRL